MTAPETIWVGEYGWQVFAKYRGEGDVEYRRADLPPTDAQIMAHPKVQALVEAVKRHRELSKLWNYATRQGRDLGEEASDAVDKAYDDVTAALAAWEAK